MPSVALLAVLAESVGGRIDGDLVVGGLERDVFAGRMGRSTDHGEHVWFGNELDGDWDTIFPCTQRLVVRRCDEAAILVAEGNGVDGTQMVIVFLDHLPASCVVL